MSQSAQSHQVIGCTICYQTRSQLREQDIDFSTCLYCDSAYCNDCLTDWMIQQITGRHIKRFDKIQLKCHQEKCEKRYTMEELQIILGEKLFAQADEALTSTYLRAHEQFITCPNNQCKNIGFLPDLCCSDSIECQICGIKWKLPCQPKSSWLLNSLMNISQIYNTNTYSDLYKVLFAQMCPSCHVMIVRSEGCKFMECAKCKFQFCWFCLSEFYTEYHYYESLCPLRIIPIYGVVILCSLLVYLKLFYIFELVHDCTAWVFYNFMIQVLAMISALTISYAFSILWSLMKLSTEMRRANLTRNRALIARTKAQVRDKVQQMAFVIGGVIVLGLTINKGIAAYDPRMAQKITSMILLHLVIVIIQKIYTKVQAKRQGNDNGIQHQEAHID